MKNSIQKIVLTIVMFITLSNLQAKSVESTLVSKRDPVNYTVILDLSDRVLNTNQLTYDIEQIKTMFDKFKQKARQNLIITSKDRFIVRIIPQKNSPLDVNHYEKLLQIRLDQIGVRDKNNRMNQFETELPNTLEKLKSIILPEIRSRG